MLRTSLAPLSLVAVLSWVAAASAATDPVLKCEASKLSAAGKAAAANLKCHAKAATKGTAVDIGDHFRHPEQGLWKVFPDPDRGPGRGVRGLPCRIPQCVHLCGGLQLTQAVECRVLHG